MDFTNCSRVSGKAYNGANGKKIAVEYNGDIYMIKFPPQPTRKESELSYTNSCFSEYICCHIFNMLGIPAQETLLGTFTVGGKEKIVCACKDFTSDDINLFDFCSIKNTIIDSELNGKGTELDEIMETIQLQKYIDPQELSNRFFDVFIADALVGNFDRHNGNWGFLYNRRENSYSIAPVFDCGSCLLPQADDNKLEKLIQSSGELNARIYNYPLSAINYKGKKINYYDFIGSGEIKECEQAVERIVPRINMNEINQFIDNTPYISDVKKSFYKLFIEKRLEIILEPVYQHIMQLNSQGQNITFSSI